MQLLANIYCIQSNGKFINVPNAPSLIKFFNKL